MQPVPPDKAIKRVNQCGNGSSRGEVAFAAIFTVSLIAVFTVHAAVVHVYEQTEAGGVITQIGDTTLDTGRAYTTQAAPAKSGYIFTHWTISTSQAFTNRDAWGRAYDAAPYTLYEDTTLTAHYLPASQDSDNDGIADGHEIYWYGGLAFSPDSDTDNDGYTFAQEIARGTNPLFPERHEEGPITYADGAQRLYNPFGYQPYTIRSEPEGALFATVSDYKRPGEAIVSSDAYVPSVSSSAFAYWSLNGVRQADAWGRALDSISLTMPSNAVEIVAVAESDYMTRMSLYWYGSPVVSASADTDNDGATFAEELAAGTNPLFPERHEEGPVKYADTALWQYNPWNLQPYTLRSEPEGALFVTTSDYARAGVFLSFAKPSGNFAYWRVNGAEQRDAWGRAVDSLDFAMPTNAIELVAVAESDYDTRMSLYWYGVTGVSQSSDTDNDGKTFAEELAAGTNPLFPERHEEGPVKYADTGEHEMNLQPYEQVQGMLIDNQFTHFFTSPIAGNETRSETFGDDLQPVVWDLNGDGLFDLVLVYKGGYKTFVNVGFHGNPEFEERRNESTNGVDLAMNDLAKLGALELDVLPVEALSATTNGAALLVSDAAGRIWYYQRRVEDNAPYQLQHKVWGGSHAGFAEGLRLAAVDWDEDGDLDCLAGTAGGKLMLLRDPKVGRPTGLKAEAGVDTVVLTWDPNRQSRIRGYRVYRAAADSGLAPESSGRLAEVPLPTYRDAPPEITSYDYKVSSVSRFYTAGNSTPTITESPATEAVRATLGGVKFNWRDVNTRVGERVEVVIAIENALNYDVAGKSQSVSYDPEYLRPVEVLKSGLTENIVMVDDGLAPSSSGRWSVTMTSGILPAGSGRFLTFVFEALKEGVTTVGGAVDAQRATVAIAARSEIAPYQLGDVDGDGDVDVEDLRLLAKLKNGNRKWNADQLKAGDFNGNGKLDNDDYQALRARLKELEILR